MEHDADDGRPGETVAVGGHDDDRAARRSGAGRRSRRARRSDGPHAGVRARASRRLGDAGRSRQRGPVGASRYAFPLPAGHRGRRRADRRRNGRQSMRPTVCARSRLPTSAVCASRASRRSPRSRSSRAIRSMPSRAADRCATSSSPPRTAARSDRSPAHAARYDDRPEMREAIMKLEGSCHCGAVKFTRRIAHALPLHALLLLDLPQDRRRRRVCDQHHGRRRDACRCAARRRSASTGRGIREQARANERRCRRHDGTSARSAAARSGCSTRNGREWIYPFASAIDTPLPKPPEHVELMLDFAAPWVDIPGGSGHTHFREYPTRASRIGTRSAGSTSLRVQQPASALAT